MIVKFSIVASVIILVVIKSFWIIQSVREYSRFSALQTTEF